VAVSLGCGSGSEVIYACGASVLVLVCVTEAFESRHDVDAQSS
jgi:hypothetical protein